MKKISINNIIKFSVDGVIALLIVMSITATANFLWWAVKPSEANVLSNVAPQNINDKIAQNIVNNAPFGVIQKKVESAAPIVVDEVKVVGIYAGGAQNSIAFLLVNNQSEIAKIGDKIVSGTVKAILPNGIVLTNDGNDRTIELSSGTASPNQPAPNMAPNIQRNEPHDNHIEQNNTNAVNQNVNNNQQNSNPPGNNHGGMDDVVAQRRKMIEQFQQQNNNSN